MFDDSSSWNFYEMYIIIIVKFSLICFMISIKNVNGKQYKILYNMYLFKIILKSQNNENVVNNNFYSIKLREDRALII